MSSERPNLDAAPHVQSGPEIVAAFVNSLKDNSALDAGTVAAIDGLLAKGRLTFTNLLKALEEVRGKSGI